MSYQEPIYNQNGNGERNQTVPVVNTSSDICVFAMPFFAMSGASKIDCNEQVCTISGISYNNILTATTECFTTAAMSATCFNSVNWTTNIYEDNTLVSSNIFYDSTSIGDVATEAAFSGSVTSAFDTLGYEYSFSGLQYTIVQEGFDELRVDINTVLSYDDNCRVSGNTTGDTSCSCPSGYTFTPAFDECEAFVYTASTTGATIYTATTGPNNSVFGQNGTVFLPNIMTYAWPLEFSGNTGVHGIYSGTNFVLDANNEAVNAIVGGPGIAYNGLPQVTTDVWDSNGSSAKGRLNVAGITSGSLGDWVGYTFCIDVPEAGTYHLGASADDAFRLSLNGDKLFYQTRSFGGFLPPYTIYSLMIQHHWVFEVELPSSKNLFHAEYLNSNSGIC